MLALGERTHRDLLATVAGLEPANEAAVESVAVVLDDDHLVSLRRERNHLAALDAVAGDIDALALDLDQAVVHELACLRAGRGPAGAEHNVVEAALKELQQDFTRGALQLDGLFVRLFKLTFEDAIDVLRLLLFLHLGEVLRRVATTAGAPVLAGREGATLKSGPTLFVLEDVDAEAARDAHLGSGVTSHCSVISLAQPRRRLGKRQPLWGTGVTSLIEMTSMPVF